GERVRKYVVMPRQRRGGVAIERRADGSRDLRHRHILGMQDAVAVFEVVHVRNLSLTIRVARSDEWIEEKFSIFDRLFWRRRQGLIVALGFLARIDSGLIGGVEISLAPASRQYKRCAQEHDGHGYANVHRRISLCRSLSLADVQVFVVLGKTF